ncbi:hypothetical protein CCHR01_10193 [Colletotrichum chrysophilum]|uniref:Uncharacterized protein n=1 Tax=Colletotrichum chrysophilum TaxID=1836956 RepID=A0AAD9AFC5_9PEZI|nr:hypothetical protein CCHR01_10193 [Colletotrichum chrysophilum]
MIRRISWPTGCKFRLTLGSHQPINN